MSQIEKILLSINFTGGCCPALRGDHFQSEIVRGLLGHAASIELEMITSPFVSNNKIALICMFLISLCYTLYYKIFSKEIRYQKFRKKISTKERLCGFSHSFKFQRFSWIVYCPKLSKFSAFRFSPHTRSGQTELRNCIE